MPGCLYPVCPSVCPLLALSGLLPANFAANCRTLHKRTCPVNVLSHFRLTNPATQIEPRVSAAPPPPSQALWLYQFKIKSSLICSKRMACMWHASLPIINHTEHKQTFQSINRRSVRYKWQTVNEMKISFRIRIWQQIFGSNHGEGEEGGEVRARLG